MSERREESILRYLEGRADDEERKRLEREMAASPPLRAEVERVRAGLDAMRRLAEAPAEVPSLAAPVLSRLESDPLGRAPSGRPLPRSASPWRLAASIAALLLLPAAGWVARGAVEGSGGQAPAGVEATPGSVAPGVAPGAGVPGREWLLLLVGAWPDAETVTVEEEIMRVQSYMTWIEALRAEERYVVGHQLGTDPGLYLTRTGMEISEFRPELAAEEVVVGFVLIRAESEEEARRIARACPHVEYGGTVIVRPAAG